MRYLLIILVAIGLTLLPLACGGDTNAPVANTTDGGNDTDVGATDPPTPDPEPEDGGEAIIEPAFDGNIPELPDLEPEAQDARTQFREIVMALPAPIPADVSAGHREDAAEVILQDPEAYMNAYFALAELEGKAQGTILMNYISDPIQNLRNSIGEAQNLLINTRHPEDSQLYQMALERIEAGDYQGAVQVISWDNFPRVFAQDLAGQDLSESYESQVFPAIRKELAEPILRHMCGATGTEDLTPRDAIQALEGLEVSSELRDLLPMVTDEEWDTVLQGIQRTYLSVLSDRVSLIRREIQEEYPIGFSDMEAEEYFMSMTDAELDALMPVFRQRFQEPLSWEVDSISRQVEQILGGWQSLIDRYKENNED